MQTPDTRADHIPGPDRRGFVLSVTSPNSSTGKSTLALNLATYLGLQSQAVGKTVVLVDAAGLASDIGKCLGAYQPNVEQLTADPDGIHPDHIGRYLRHEPDLNLSVLLGPVTPDASLAPDAALYTQIVTTLRAQFDYVIIDTPVTDATQPLFTEFVLPASDFVLAVSQANPADWAVLDAWLTVITTNPTFRPTTAPTSHDDADDYISTVGYMLILDEGQDEPSWKKLDTVLGSWIYLGACFTPANWRSDRSAARIAVLENFAYYHAPLRHIVLTMTGQDLLHAEPALTAPRAAGRGWRTWLRRRT